MKTNCDKTVWIRGGCQCEITPQPVGRIWRFVLLGAPGVGKGSQAELLSEKLGICQLCTGDIFRSIKHLPESDITPALKLAYDYMARGELVPDDIVIKIVRERIKCLKCPNGYALDGFPRTIPQAEALDQMLRESNVKLDAVINLTMPEEEIIERLSSRRICSKCGAIYNLKNKPPKIPGKCDLCGADLYQREDDKPEAIKVRMEIYQKTTAPLIDYYSKKGELVTIDGSGTVFDTYKRLKAALDVNGEMPD
ncbi:MAG: adenylate kinase [Verrucomicrobiia bacterium]